jgi:hypothetical protein
VASGIRNARDLVIEDRALGASREPSGVILPARSGDLEPEEKSWSNDEIVEARC